MKYYVYNYVDRTKVSDKEFAEKNMFSNNIGNIFFLQGVCNSLNAQIIGETSGGGENIQAYLLPVANMFRNSAQNEIDYIRKKLLGADDKKIIIAGCGAQGDLHYTRNFTDEETDTCIAEFCRFILSHSKSIGVRGEFTKRYLTGLGISPEYIDVIGCPSVRMFGKKFNTSLRQYKPFSRDLKIAVNFTPYHYIDDVAAFIYQTFKNYPKSFAMMQDKVEYDLLYEGKEIPDKFRVHALLPTYKDNFVIRSNRARMFLSVDNWIDCLKTFDFSIGTRIHGNIIAILAGVPAMVIAIDSRTRELAEFHHIPYVLADEIDGLTSLELLYYKACAGMNDFYFHYNSNLKIYCDFMTKNGIKLKSDWIV